MPKLTIFQVFERVHTYLNQLVEPVLCVDKILTATGKMYIQYTNIDSQIKCVILGQEKLNFLSGFVIKKTPEQKFLIYPKPVLESVFTSKFNIPFLCGEFTALDQTTYKICVGKLVSLRYKPAIHFFSEWSKDKLDYVKLWQDNVFDLRYQVKSSVSASDVLNQIEDAFFNGDSTLLYKRYNTLSKLPYLSYRVLPKIQSLIENALLIHFLLGVPIADLKVMRFIFEQLGFNAKLETETRKILVMKNDRYYRVDKENYTRFIRSDLDTLHSFVNDRLVV